MCCVSRSGYKRVSGVIGVEEELVQSLLQPALCGVTDSLGRGRPFRSPAIFAVGFFGGTLALAVFASVSAVRFRAPRLWLLVLALATLLALVGAGFTFAMEDDGLVGDPLARNLITVCVFLVYYALMRRRERALDLFVKDAFAPALLPGLATVFTLHLIETPLTELIGEVLASALAGGLP